MHLPTPHIPHMQSMPIHPQPNHQRDTSSCPPPSVRPAAGSASLRLAIAHSEMSKYYAVRGARQTSAPPFAASSARRPTLPSLRDALGYPPSPTSAKREMHPIDRLLEPSFSMPRVFLRNEKLDLIGAAKGSISPKHHRKLLEKLLKEYPLAKDEGKVQNKKEESVGLATEEDEDEKKGGRGIKRATPDLRINCHCGNASIDFSSVIPCPTCSSWSHIPCYSYDVTDPILEFQCYACQPKLVKMEETDLGYFKLHKESSPMSDLSDEEMFQSSIAWSRPSSPLSLLSGTACTSEFEEKEDILDGEDEEDSEYEVEEAEEGEDVFDSLVSARPIHPLPRRLASASSSSSSIICKQASLPSSKSTSIKHKRDRDAPSPEVLVKEEEEVYHVGFEDEKIVRRDGSVLYLNRNAFMVEGKAIFDRGSRGIRAELKNTPNTITLTCRNGRKTATKCEWRLQAVAPSEQKLTEDQKTWTIETAFLEHNEACGGRVFKPNVQVDAKPGAPPSKKRKLKQSASSSSSLSSVSSSSSSSSCSTTSLDAIAAECDYLLEQEAAAAASTISSDLSSISPASNRGTRSKKAGKVMHKAAPAPIVSKQRQRQKRVKPKEQVVAASMKKVEKKQVAIQSCPPSKKKPSRSWFPSQEELAAHIASKSLPGSSDLSSIPSSSSSSMSASEDSLRYAMPGQSYSSIVSSRRGVE